MFFGFTPTVSWLPCFGFLQLDPRITSSRMRGLPISSDELYAYGSLNNEKGLNSENTTMGLGLQGWKQAGCVLVIRLA